MASLKKSHASSGSSHSKAAKFEIRQSAERALPDSQTGIVFLKCYDNACHRNIVVNEQIDRAWKEHQIQRKVSFEFCCFAVATPG